ncbi:MAG: methionine biosynthesis protein MetW [Alphaproteobacteria bacterium]
MAVSAALAAEPARARPLPIRPDLKLIADMIAPGSRVLDIGCGDGALLDYLVHEKAVDGRGVEISQAGVNACVSHGLSVIQGDADKDLKDYPSGAFDFAILSQTLQATHAPRMVLGELVRIARRAIVSVPNFGHWRVRLELFIRGRMPATELFSESWHASPNIHPCTIRDFVLLCREMGIRIDRQVSPGRFGGHAPVPRPLANLVAHQAIFLLSRAG